MSLNILVIREAGTCYKLLTALDIALHEVDEVDNGQDLTSIELQKYAVIITRIGENNLETLCDFVKKVSECPETRHIPVIAYIPYPAFVPPEPFDHRLFTDIFAPMHTEEYRQLSMRINAISRRFQEISSMEVSADVLGINIENYQEKKEVIAILIDDTMKLWLQNSILDRLETQYRCKYFSTPAEAIAAVKEQEFQLIIVDSRLGREALKFASYAANKKLLNPVIILVDPSNELILQQSMDVRSQGVLFLETPAHIIDMKIATTLHWTEMYNYNQQLLDRQIELSQRDELTTLFNRRYMKGYADKLLEQASIEEQPFCVCVVDIDHFKSINDTYGHLIGDEVLKCLAGAMQSRVRLQDVIGRWGGEEFVIIFTNLNPELGAVLADRMRKHIEENDFPISQIEGAVRVTVSIGFTSSKPNDTFTEIIKRADEALYIAKDQGRNRVVSFENIS